MIPVLVRIRRDDVAESLPHAAAEKALRSVFSSLPGLADHVSVVRLASDLAAVVYVTADRPENAERICTDALRAAIASGLLAGWSLSP